MFVIPPILVLLVYFYIRPQEVYEALRPVTVPMLIAFVGFGYLLDLRLGDERARRPKLLLALAAAFWCWSMVTVTVASPDVATEYANWAAATVALFFAIALGISTLRGLRVVTVGLLAITIAITAICIDQGLTPSTCVSESSATGTLVQAEGVGRPCATPAECTDPTGTGREFLCEHLGLMKTYSVTQRVRYRGVFQDPNELAWSLSLALPFVFAWYERRRARGDARLRDRVVVAAVLVAFVVCNVMTKSRSGQISLVATLGVYFVSRFGWRGIAVGAVGAIPVLLLGGRSDEASTNERLECWAEALSLWREHPFVGVGARQFGQHYYLTAHNSPLLTLSEMGPLGLVLFTAIIYVAFKTMLTAQRDLADRPEAAEARALAFATAAALVGTIASSFFLSLAYHVALWILLGVAAAVHATMLRHDPEWSPRWRWLDGVAIVGLDVAIVAGIAVYLRMKGL